MNRKSTSLEPKASPLIIGTVWTIAIFPAIPFVAFSNKTRPQRIAPLLVLFAVITFLNLLCVAFSLTRFLKASNEQIASTENNPREQSIINLVFGVASFILSISAGVLLHCIIVGYIRFPASRYVEHFLLLGLPSLALVLGAVGIVTNKHKNYFAIIGTITSLLIVFFLSLGMLIFSCIPSI